MEWGIMILDSRIMALGWNENLKFLGAGNAKYCRYKYECMDLILIVTACCGAWMPTVDNVN